MKIAVVSRSDAHGGAARASYRLHRALRAEGHESRMWVGAKSSDDPGVTGPQGALAVVWSRLRPGLANVVLRLQRSADRAWRSPGLFPSGLGRALDRSDADIVNLHWVGEETLSVPEIGRLAKPVVWTMHDMWPFCGAEHYAPEDAGARWRTGYRAGQRAEGASGLDIDAWVWRRKRANWRPFPLIAPSRWLADCARASALMGDWPVSVVPYSVDTGVFRPHDAAAARAEWGLPAGAPLVLFVAVGGRQERRKGWDLLATALETLAAAPPGLRCVLVGEKEPSPAPRLPVPVHWIDYVSGDDALARLYSAADVIAVPSRQDNLPLVATDAQACGCPVVAFAASGMTDAVEHGVSGYLAEPFAPADLARGIAWVLGDRERHRRLRAQARERAQRLWSPGVIARAYLDVFGAAIAAHRAGAGQ